MTSTSSNRSVRSGWKLPAIALLWGEGAFLNFYYKEELEAALKLWLGVELMLWGLFGVILLLELLQRRGLWMVASFAAMAFGIVRICLIDETEREVQRWKAQLPALEARLPKILNTSLFPRARDRSGAYSVEPNVRVILDQQGTRYVAFIRHQVRGDGTWVYIYSPTDSIAWDQVDFLYGFGGLDRRVPLNKHWYLCYFN